jgi:hypothetical protein
MMQRVVNTTRCFAYVPNFANYRANIGDVALLAQLEEVEFLPDGRCMLEAKLSGRFTIVDHYGEQRLLPLFSFRRFFFSFRPTYLQTIHLLE